MVWTADSGGVTADSGVYTADGSGPPISSQGPSCTSKVWDLTVQLDGKLHSAPPQDSVAPSVPIINLDQATTQGFRVLMSTPPVDIQSGIASCPLEAQIGAGPWVQFAAPTLAQFPYVWTNAVAGTLYNVRCSAIDASANANRSVPSIIKSITTVASSSAAIKYTPGHWVNIDRGSGQKTVALQCAFIVSLANLPQVVGVMVYLRWSECETNVRGVYDWTIADQFVAAAAQAGKKLMISWDYTIFSGSDLTSSGGKLPSYIVKQSTVGFNSANTPGYYLRPAGGASQQFVAMIACLWFGATMDALIALTNAFNVRYNSNPVVEGISVGETTIGTLGSVGNSAGNLKAQWKRWASASRVSGPKMEVWVQGNYLGTDTDTLDLITYCNGIKVITTGGPDSGPQRSFQFNRVFNGAQMNLGNGVVTGINYIGTIPNFSQNQYPNGASGGADQTTTPAILYNYAETGDRTRGGSMLPNKYIWYQSNWKGSAGWYFTWTDVRAFIVSINGAAHMGRPPGY